MDKTEWPTETRLEELREQGEVAYSAFATRCLVASGLCGAVALALDGLKESVDIYYKLASNQDFIAHALSFAWNFIWSSMLLIAVIALMVSFFSRMFQTKMLFRPSNIRLDLGRLNRFEIPSPWKTVRSTMASIIHVLAVLLVASTTLYFSLYSALEIMNQSPERMGDWVLERLFSIAPVLIAVPMMGALLLWLYSRLHFGMKHRMSRSEVEAESFHE